MSLNRSTPERGAAVNYSYNNTSSFQPTSSPTRRFRRISDAEAQLTTYSNRPIGICVKGSILIMFLIRSISALVVGAYYLNSCPINKNIPIYLIVAGAFICVQILISVWDRVNKSGFTILIHIFLLIWFVIGSAWIFMEYEPQYDVGAGEKYCNKRLYLFAFWITIIDYILLIVIFILFCMYCSFVDLSKIEVQ